MALIVALLHAFVAAPAIQTGPPPTPAVIAGPPLSLEASAPTLLLGDGASVEITIAALGAASTGAAITRGVALPPAGPPRLTVNVGEVSEPRLVAPGKYTATYKPPAKRYPQLAIFLAQDPNAPMRHAWLALPLLAKETLSLETKPRAQVEVDVGDKTYGPLKADKRGRVKVPVVVPPGVAAAIVRSLDLAGNKKQVSLPLEPPPFSRLRVALLGLPGASWSDPAPLAVEAFVALPSGAPDPSANLVTLVNRGTLSAPSTTAAGLYAMSYRAPDVLDDDTADIRVSLREEPAMLDGVKVALAAGPPAKLDLTLDPPEIAAGDDALVTITARALDQKGNVVVTARPAIAPEIGQLIQQGTLTQLRVPADSKAKTAITIIASLPPLRRSIALRVGPAPPARGQLTVGLGVARAGASAIKGELMLFDRFNNPVPDVALTVIDPPGQSEIRSIGKGRYEVAHAVAAEANAGPGTLALRTADGKLTVSTPITVLPARKSWGIALGAEVFGGINFARTTNVGGTLELAIRPAQWPVELTVMVGGRYYIPVQTGFAAGGPSGRTTVTLTGMPIAFGARFNLPVSQRWALQFAANGGVQPSWSTISLSSTSGTLRQRGYFVAPIVGVGAGVAAQVGPGRLRAEVSWQLIYGTGDVRGNVGGFGLTVGYLYDLR
ncbi:MAG: hypothetical protein IT381_12875 [Deltaproteobacteria bacterium]|nr:hypothetical protein [Deltaproteobacteria bacterium]